MKKIHQPVLLEEVLSVIDLQEGDSFIDCTFGAGGHSEAILPLIGPRGKILALERDGEILNQIKETWFNKSNVQIVNQRFSELKEVVSQNNFGLANAVLLDLGVSSWQIDLAKRGFSIRDTDHLDMRMGLSNMTAAQYLNMVEAKDLITVFSRYGDIKNSRNIVEKIIRYREEKPIERSSDLIEILKSIKITKDNPRNLLVRIWQSIRMVVNEEEQELKSVLPQAVEILKPGGVLVIISFHSGEDRIVKNFFQEHSRHCVCPADFPTCICQTKPDLKIITKKALKPTKKEIIINPRSSSAKLRAARKI